MSRPYGFYSLPYQTQMSIRRNESDVRRAQGRAAANAREAEAAAEELNALKARVAELEAENDRLSKAVGSGILGELLNDEETDEFVKFIKFLRTGKEPEQ